VPGRRRVGGGEERELQEQGGQHYEPHGERVGLLDAGRCRMVVSSVALQPDATIRGWVS
jgi:hypothetical protein